MADEAIHQPQLRTAGGPEMDAWAAKHLCPGCQNDRHQCICDDDGERHVCQECGGEGLLELHDAGPSYWGEDCCSEENRLVTCRACNGTGNG